MEKIKFDNTQDLKWRLLIGLSILLLPIALMRLSGSLEFIPFGSPKFFDRMMNLGIIIINIISFRFIWYKYYVLTGTERIYIKINSFLGKSIRISEIKSVLFENSKLKINVIGGGKVIEFDLGKIELDDRQHLYEILRKKSPYTNRKTIKRNIISK